MQKLRWILELVPILGLLGSYVGLIHPKIPGGGGPEARERERDR